MYAPGREYMIVLPMSSLTTTIDNAVSNVLSKYYPRLTPGIVSQGRDMFVRMVFSYTLESKGMWLARIADLNSHNPSINEEIAAMVPNLKESLSKTLSEALETANLTGLFSTETTWRILTCGDILICVITTDN